MWMFKVRPITQAKAEDVLQCWANTWKFLVTFLAIFILINFSPLFLCLLYQTFKEQTRNVHPSMKNDEDPQKTHSKFANSGTHIRKCYCSWQGISTYEPKNMKCPETFLNELCLSEMTVVVIWKPQVWKWMCSKAKQNARLKIQYWSSLNYSQHQIIFINRTRNAKACDSGQWKPQCCHNSGLMSCSKPSSGVPTACWWLCPCAWTPSCHPTYISNIWCQLFLCSTSHVAQKHHQLRN